MIEPWFIRDTAPFELDEGCGTHTLLSRLDQEENVTCGSDYGHGVVLCDRCWRIKERLNTDRQLRLQEERFPMPL